MFVYFWTFSPTVRCTSIWDSSVGEAGCFSKQKFWYDAVSKVSTGKMKNISIDLNQRPLFDIFQLVRSEFRRRHRKSSRTLEEFLSEKHLTSPNENKSLTNSIFGRLVNQECDLKNISEQSPFIKLFFKGVNLTMDKLREMEPTHGEMDGPIKENWKMVKHRNTIT